jgi:hypothetical protein
MFDKVEFTVGNRRDQRGSFNQIISLQRSISIRKLYPPLPQNFFSPLATVIFRLLSCPFCLTVILPYFAFILCFYFPFSLSLYPLFLFLFPFFLNLLNFPLRLFPFSYFPPQMTSARIPRGDIFQYHSGVLWTKYF